MPSLPSPAMRRPRFRCARIPTPRKTKPRDPRAWKRRTAPAPLATFTMVPGGGTINAIR
jgi:hypothetical protein